MIKAVIFDMDGVLIDSEPLHFDAMKGVLKKHGISIAEGDMDRFLGETNERVWNTLKGEFDLPENIDVYIGEQLEMTLECLKNGDYKPIEGILELLEQLRSEGIPVGVASSSPPVIIDAILDAIGVDKYIDKWVSGDEVQESKPAPYIYLKAAEMMGFPPAECLAIEDSFLGVTAAKTAGLKCIGYKAPHAVEQDLSKADLILTSITEITPERMNTI